MKLRVLGCHGRLTPRHRSTGFLLDDETLLDGGTINSALELDDLLRVRRLLLTHAHADHIKEIPFLLMDRANRGLPPLEVFAVAPVIEALRHYFLNGVLWPDFSAIGEPPALVYREIETLRPVETGELRFTAYPVHHTVPCTGFLIEKGDLAFIFTGDTGTTDVIWRAADRHRNVRTVLVETTFADAGRATADQTGHYCPQTLAADVAKVGRPLDLLITHTRPEQVGGIRRDLAACGLSFRLVEQDQDYSL